jgi:hypothetical protein
MAPGMNSPLYFRRKTRVKPIMAVKLIMRDFRKQRAIRGLRAR